MRQKSTTNYSPSGSPGRSQGWVSSGRNNSSHFLMVGDFSGLLGLTVWVLKQGVGPCGERHLKLSSFWEWDYATRRHALPKPSLLTLYRNAGCISAPSEQLTNQLNEDKALYLCWYPRRIEQPTSHIYSQGLYLGQFLFASLVRH